MHDTLAATGDYLRLRSIVADLVPEFRARAGEGERLRTVPADLLGRAKAAGLFRLSLPRSLGGFELDAASSSIRPLPWKYSKRSAGPTVRPAGPS
jgi:alkylation response protein AidB-like acyl-CoA dehydrogenase